MESAKASFRYAEPHLPVIALIAVVAEPGYYIWWELSDPDGYENLVLRLIATALVLPLASRRLLSRFEGWMTFLFCLASAFCLPFFFCFLLLMNADSIEPGSPVPIQSPMQYAVSLVLLVLLFPRGLLVTLIFLTSTASAWALFLICRQSSDFGTVNEFFWGLMPVYVFILIAGTVFNRNRAVIDQEKLRAAASIGSTIAHELRTPLLGIRALAEGLEMHLAQLIQSHAVASQRGLVQPLRNRHQNHLKSSLGRIEREIDHSNSVIDMLLLNSAERPLEGLPYDQFSAARCVREAISRYPFNTASDQRLVTASLERDFQIRAPRVLIVHVLFNLIKNAVYYVEKARKGGVHFQLGVAGDFNTIVVEDSGTGIAPEHMKRIYERFFTTTKVGGGSGIGLSFCKMILEGIGGSIHCESELGSFTRFTLYFPRVQEA
jgi:two-component system CAI-1 autoinducer sensor kinase/phosphatase CqsS